jgi:hypothetical protein
MESKDINFRLEGIDEKLQRFFQKHREVLLTNEKLEKENRQLQLERQQLKDDLQSFQNQGKIGKIVGRLEDDGSETKELKNMLDKYITEIDQCLDFLKD